MSVKVFDFPAVYLSKKREKHIIVHLFTEKSLKNWLKGQDKRVKALIKNCAFSAKAKQNYILYGENGEVLTILAGISAPVTHEDLAHTVTFIQKNFPSKLLKGISFEIDTSSLSADEAERAYIGWGNGCYEFIAYKKSGKEWPKLVWERHINQNRVKAFVQATALLRNLINTPANDMGPEDIEKAAQHTAEKFKAKINVTTSAALKKGFPLVHAVGHGSPKRPRLIDLKWGNAKHPKVTLVGKGVSFDTGGLNIKPTQYMALMKKDMGGAAHALALGWLIMSLKLPVNLRILIPAVENAVSGDSFRPGDIYKSRKGLTVENTNTDAEGRLIVADALTYACEDNPQLVIDYTTLTGSARAALGHDIPAVFSNNEKLAEQLKTISIKAEDPVWPMPLWKPYKKHIESPVADLVNSASIPGDLIYSALFLQSFLSGKPDWLHLDIFAWESAGRPGRPKGGADTGLRSVFTLLEKRYGG